MIQIYTNVDPFTDDDSTPPPVRNTTSRVIGSSVLCMAGYVLRKLLKPISCDIRRQSVTSQEPSIRYLHNFELLEIKNRGGLVRPCEEVIFIFFGAISPLINS
jgi:hypothetical protein